MRGTMMDFPLTLPTILERAGKIFPRVEIVSRKPDKSITRTCFGEFYRRARRLAAPSQNSGMKARRPRCLHDVESLRPSRSLFRRALRRRHPAHLNLRLHPHEIAGIAKQAGDRFLIIDDVLLPLLRKIPPRCALRTSHRRAV